MGTLYKILKDGKSCHGGDQKWPMPNGKPGKWIEAEGELSVCSRGLHLTNKPYLWYVWGCDCYEAEGKELIGTRDDKFCFRSARLIKRVEHPSWWQQAIQFVNDELPKTRWLKPDGKPLKAWKLFTGETWNAARDVAGNAAVDAARDVARDVAGNVAGNVAWNAAVDAARDVAGNVAGNAAWNAAVDAARDVAGNVAGNVAGDAARDVAGNVARDVARDVAGNVAWNVARDVAWNAARDVALVVRYKIVSDLEFKDKEKHLKHIYVRWQVWQKGYALLCDVDGVLYVYAARKQ